MYVLKHKVTGKYFVEYRSSIDCSIYSKSIYNARLYKSIKDAKQTQVKFEKIINVVITIGELK
jgi:hypothetical protein